MKGVALNQARSGIRGPYQRTSGNHDMETWSHTSVQCYSGYKAVERPVSFRVNGDELNVLKIVESWYEPDHLYFRVQASDGLSYILRHHEYEDLWEVRVLSEW